MQPINRRDLERMNDAGDRDFVLINVLSPEAFNQQHIRTSINVPQESQDFEDTVALVAGGKDRDIVVYCKNHQCNASTRAAEKLEDAGFSSVFDYEGGTEDWMKNH